VSNLSGNAFSGPLIAVNINGVYLATPTTFRGLFYDLDRVELLKGPQGTLYGRNATGGAINIIPARPTFNLGGTAGVTLGDYSHFDANAALNVPLSDQVAIRVAGQHAKHKGYMSLGTNDEDVNALRGSILFQPSSDVSILLTADWAREGGKGPGATLRKACSALGRTGTSCFVADPYTDVGDLPGYYTSVGIAAQTRHPYLDSDYYGVGLNAGWTTGIGTVSLVASYRKSNVRYSTTATSWQLIEHQKPTQKSVELRRASPSGQRIISSARAACRWPRSRNASIRSGNWFIPARRIAARWRAPSRAGSASSRANGLRCAGCWIVSGPPTPPDAAPSAEARPHLMTPKRCEPPRVHRQTSRRQRAALLRRG